MDFKKFQELIDLAEQKIEEGAGIDEALFSLPEKPPFCIREGLEQFFKFKSRIIPFLKSAGKINRKEVEVSRKEKILGEVASSIILENFWSGSIWDDDLVKVCEEFYPKSINCEVFQFLLLNQAEVYFFGFSEGYDSGGEDEMIVQFNRVKHYLKKKIKKGLAKIEANPKKEDQFWKVFEIMFSDTDEKGIDNSGDLLNRKIEKPEFLECSYPFLNFALLSIQNSQEDFFLLIEPLGRPLFPRNFFAFNLAS